MPSDGTMSWLFGSIIIALALLFWYYWNKREIKAWSENRWN